MSPAQRTFYFSLWNRVMVEQGWHHLRTAEKDAKRRALHVQAGCKNADGTAKSSKAFTNADFDLFKAECLKLTSGQRNGGEPRVADDGQRRRLVWRIRDDAKKAGLSPEYIAEVARDLHVLGNWQDLDLPGLTNLMKTIHNRAGKKLGHDPRNVEHKRRHYVLDKVPRMFRPQPAAKPAPAAIVDDNQPF